MSALRISVKPASRREVYCFIGDSTMISADADPTELPTTPVNLQNPQADVLFSYSKKRAGEGSPTTGSLVSLQPASAAPTRHGPEITFGRAMADAGRSVLVLVYADGGSTSQEWVNTKGALARTFFSTELAALGSLYVVRGLIWNLGTNDTASIATQWDTLQTAFSSWAGSTLWTVPIRSHVDNANATDATVRASQVSWVAASPSTRTIVEYDTGFTGAVGDSFQLFAAATRSLITGDSGIAGASLPMGSDRHPDSEHNRIVGYRIAQYALDRLYLP